MQDADNKSAQGDFERAVNLYEAALDDSPRGAEVHYKLALLYDDKLNDPVSALHHFKRYLALKSKRPACERRQGFDQARRDRRAHGVVRRFRYHSGGSGAVAQ